MGNNCSCFSKDEPSEVTVDKKPGTRKEASPPPSDTPQVDSAPVDIDKWSLGEVQFLQDAFRGYIQRKALRKPISELVLLDWLEDSEQITVKEENYQNASLPLTPEAEEKCSRIRPFVYSIKTLAGDAKGPVLMSDDSIYIGQWKNGRRYGRGVCYLTTGTLMEGYWSNGLHLKGRTVFPNGDMYEGDYVHMRKEGRGRFEDLTGKVSYEGDWMTDMKHGYGVEHLADGSSYEGYFTNDSKNGRGKFSWPTGEVYEGEFKDNKIHGVGKYVWNESKWYDGEWFEGSMHGKGHLMQEGKDYVGDFVKDKKHGNGVLNWDGNVYDGEFQNNKMHGKGFLSQKGKPPKLYAFDNNKRGAAIEDAPAS